MIHGAVEDSAGRIWVGTSSDLYLGVDGEFRPELSVLPPMYGRESAGHSETSSTYQPARRGSR